LPARPTLAPHIRFLSINSHFCAALPSDLALRRQPLRLASPSPPSGWAEDFHLQATKHARHTTKPTSSAWELRGGVIGHRSLRPMVLLHVEWNPKSLEHCRRACLPAPPSCKTFPARKCPQRGSVRSAGVDRRSLRPHTARVASSSHSVRCNLSRSSK